jgi:uncharacterized membrane protein YedE/YeeE
MINALMGGALIGIAVSLMLVFNGRVTGISGIVGGILKPHKGDVSWRLFFIFGLFFGGIILRFFAPATLEDLTNKPIADFVIGGLLVGFGTLLGNGCTSGHGVCGISRFSPRSILATITFISFGIISVLIFKTLRGEL